MESAPNNNANITTIKISVKQMVTKKILIYIFADFFVLFGYSSLVMDRKIKMFYNHFKSFFSMKLNHQLDTVTSSFKFYL